ncbi:MAG: hypothetical protein AAGK00_03920 [Pseudomonadota bacterium]
MLRLLGGAFILLGLVILGVEAFEWAQQDGERPFSLKPLGQWWFELSPDSYQVTQPAIERHVPGGVWIYENIVQQLRLWPASIQALGLGAILLVLRRLLR